jgi:hypothetical protein
MSLQEKIKEDYITAFKAKEKIKVLVLKMLQSEIRNAEIEKRTKLSKQNTGEDLSSGLSAKALAEEEVLSVITREAKKRKDSIEQYEKGNRPELAEQEKQELEVLTPYLPEQMSEEEIKGLVQKTIEQTNASDIKDLGKVMGALSQQTKGRADGAIVSKIVREMLKA